MKEVRKKKGWANLAERFDEGVMSGSDERKGGRRGIDLKEDGRLLEREREGNGGGMGGRWPAT